MFEILLAGFTIILIYIAFGKKRKHHLYPPGPTGLPLLGNVHQLGRRPNLAFRKWKKEYGSIFSVKFGLDDAIVINDPKLVRELFSDAAASGRVQNPIFQAFSGGRYGIINTEGEQWEEQRRFVIRTLRSLGFAKSSMECMILPEAKQLVSWFHKNQGVPIACNRVFNAAVINSIWSIVSGERTDWQDEDGNDSSILRKSETLIAFADRAIKTGLMFATFLRHIIPELSGWTGLLKAIEDLNQSSDETVNKHKAKLDQDCPQDLIDHYLVEIEKSKEPESTFHRETGWKNLKAVVLDLFVAGNETTSATLSWTLLYLSQCPVVQQKLIDEIHEVLGRSREPSIADRPSLPYTEAVILEVLRISALVPMGLFHRMLSDKMFHGFLLPKHTLIMSNIDSASRDPEYWGDPEYFRPERFLSEDGTNVIQNDALIPFSAGKRQCLGESVAKDTLFLFTVSIFQKFEVLPDPENPEPDMEPMEGFFSFPKPFRLVMKELF